jgi:hypothetical protein
VPLSTDEQKRQRQLGNLKRGNNPPPAGNQLGPTHGASTGDRLPVRERRTAYLAELAATFPSASNAELTLQATRMARLELLGAYLDQHGVIRNRRTGDVYAAAKLEEQIAGAFERQHALLTAREQARPAGGNNAASLDAVVAELTADTEVAS